MKFDMPLPLRWSVKEKDVDYLVSRQYSASLIGALLYELVVVAAFYTASD